MNSGFGDPLTFLFVGWFRALVALHVLDFKTARCGLGPQSGSLGVRGGALKAVVDVFSVLLDLGVHLVLRSAPAAAPYVHSPPLLNSAIVATVEPHAQVAARVEQVAAGQVHGRGFLLRSASNELNGLELEWENQPRGSIK